MPKKKKENLKKEEKDFKMIVIPVLAKNSPNCPKCGAPPSEHEVRNHSLIWHDGDVHCTKCGTYVRMYDAG